MIKNPAPVARCDWSGGVFAGALMGGVTWFATGALTLRALGPFYRASGKTVGLAELPAYFPHFFELAWQAKVALVLPVGTGLLAGVAAVFLVTREKARPETHCAGPRLLHGAGAQQEGRREARASRTVLKLGGLTVTQARVRRSFLILGTIGGGKTQTIWNILNGLRSDGFRLLIVDGPKGDFSSSIGDALIIAPWHKGPAWDIARDCPTRNHARELAKFLIPTSEKDPLWGNAAGMIFTSILCKLQSEKPGVWGWADIYFHLILPIPALKEIAKIHYPPAVQALADAESKTTQSIVINLTSFMADVFEMALAWAETKNTFSFSGWWRSEPGQGQQIVILQGSGEFQTLAGGYINAVVNSLANLTASPILKESTIRKNVLVIDEMAQLPRLAGVQKFLEIGRSKGCSAVLATQSPAQLREIYGEHQFSSWCGMVGTKVFVQTVGADDAAVILRELGEREVYIPATTVTTSVSGQSVSTGWTKEKTTVVRSDDLKRLGPKKHGIAAIVAGFGGDPIQILLPFALAEPIRQPFIPNDKFNRAISELSESDFALASDVEFNGNDIEHIDAEVADSEWRSATDVVPVVKLDKEISSSAADKNVAVLDGEILGVGAAELESLMSLFVMDTDSKSYTCESPVRDEIVASAKNFSATADVKRRKELALRRTERESSECL